MNEDLVEQALGIIDRAVEEHQPSHVFALFSGGDDSLASTHLAMQHPSFTAAAHINTGIGIEQTREFVRGTCKGWGIDLLELHPDDKTYDELVLDKGFPRGKHSHNAMYYYLKQRQVRRLVREHKQHAKDRIGLITGVRIAESSRRMAADLAVEVRREGAQLWIQPVLHFTKADLYAYFKAEGIERNEVSRHLHRSGECLCGAMANQEEIKVIEYFYPDAAERIHALERQCKAKGLVDSTWAAPSVAPGKTWEEHYESTGQYPLMPLCIDCEERP